MEDKTYITSIGLRLDREDGQIRSTRELAFRSNTTNGEARDLRGHSISHEISTDSSGFGALALCSIDRLHVWPHASYPSQHPARGGIDRN